MWNHYSKQSLFLVPLQMPPQNVDIDSNTLSPALLPTISTTCPASPMHLSTTHSVNQCKPNTSLWIIPPTFTHMTPKTILPSPRDLPGGFCSSHYLCARAYFCPTLFYVCVYTYFLNHLTYLAMCPDRPRTSLGQTAPVIFHSHQLTPAVVQLGHVIKPVWHMLSHFRSCPLICAK